ncbi:MAG: reductive dehalogenase [Candidatus Tectomicrobia bacterium]|nr:reductive dehalogenase [Candidatus Tectomicrobia bacterium]
MAENYQVLPGYARFNQKNNGLMRAVWDPALKSCREREARSIRRYLEEDARGFDLRDWAFDFGASTAVSAFGTGNNKPNAGFTAWEPLDVKYNRSLPPGAGRFDASDPARARGSVEKVARFLGADLVGFTELDPRWVYSHHYLPSNKENGNPPVEIPEGMNQAIVLGVAMDHQMFRTAPSVVMMSETHRNYSQMAILVASLAQFIRTLGYRAIPSLNDTALNVPLAVDAGLGQPSRLGIVITPRYGPRVRFCKVITDLPLAGKKRHVDFGVIEFREACEKCAGACPVKAVPAGGRTATGRNLSSNPGVLKWYLDAEKCRHHFAHVATNCGICLRVCPFNHGGGPHHWLAKRLVRLKSRSLNRLLVKLHGWLGYGEQKDPRFFWNGAGG